MSREDDASYKLLFSAPELMRDLSMGIFGWAKTVGTPNQIPWFKEGRRTNDFYLCGLQPDTDERHFRLALRYRLGGGVAEIRQKAESNPFEVNITVEV